MSLVRVDSEDGKAELRRLWSVLKQSYGPLGMYIYTLTMCSLVVANTPSPCQYSVHISLLHAPAAQNVDPMQLICHIDRWLSHLHAPVLFGVDLH